MTRADHAFAITLAMLLTCSACNAQSERPETMIDNTPVEDVDLNRYAGTWYEIARLPNRFEKGLTGVTATYTLLENGKIRVVNAGYRENGRYQSIKGKAKIPDPARTGWLKVSFFLFFYADYFIMELDREHYRWALVGSDSPGYLWILSRKPVLSDEIYRMLLEKAGKRGYDLDDLIMVPHKSAP